MFFYILQGVYCPVFRCRTWVYAILHQFTLQRYNFFFKYTIAYIAKNSTDFKTGAPKCAISVPRDILFLRLTLKIEPISAISGLQIEDC